MIQVPVDLTNEVAMREFFKRLSLATEQVKETPIAKIPTVSIVSDVDSANIDNIISTLNTIIIQLNNR